METNKENHIDKLIRILFDEVIAGHISECDKEMIKHAIQNAYRIGQISSNVPCFNKKLDLIDVDAKLSNLDKQIKHIWHALKLINSSKMDLCSKCDLF